MHRATRLTPEVIAALRTIGFDLDPTTLTPPRPKASSERNAWAGRTGPEFERPTLAPPSQWWCVQRARIEAGEKPGGMPASEAQTLSTENMETMGL